MNEQNIQDTAKRVFGLRLPHHVASVWCGGEKELLILIRQKLYL